jgi:hypothetical protein
VRNIPAVFEDSNVTCTQPQRSNDAHLVEVAMLVSSRVGRFLLRTYSWLPARRAPAGPVKTTGNEHQNSRSTKWRCYLARPAGIAYPCCRN